MVEESGYTTLSSGTMLCACCILTISCTLFEGESCYWNLPKSRNHKQRVCRHSSEESARPSFVITDSRGFLFEENVITRQSLQTTYFLYNACMAKFSGEWYSYPNIHNWLNHYRNVDTERISIQFTKKITSENDMRKNRRL